MSRRHQFTAIATTGALLHVAGELRHEFKEDIKELKEGMQEMKEDIQEKIENQNDTMRHLQDTVAYLNDDIKIIKEQLLLLTRESKNNRYSNQSIPNSEQGCSTISDIGDVSVSVDGNEMELRSRGLSQGECFLQKLKSWIDR